ncbi:MAG TPA: S8 family serine peptidase [Acidimicrobiia bacterium]|nr:S8 family serine peptidase [Acidimicrobiia bacterium]
MTAGRTLRLLLVALLAAILAVVTPGAGAKPDQAKGKGKGARATATAVSTANREGDQWGLALIDARTAWNTATGSGVTVAVVDSGVDAQHPEFSGRLVNGASWVCGPNASKPCANWDDENGHGTHVAGIVAAARDGQGTSGVAPAARIMPVRVLDAEGSGSTGDVAAGIRYAANHGADVINLSLGGSIPGVSTALTITGADTVVLEAIEYAVGKGALVVAAAGNSSLPICDGESFVLTDGVLCVGAVDNNDLPAWYSNFGVEIDVVAPGGSGTLFCDWDVLSTWPTDVDSFCEADGDNARTGYEELPGTSMAAPHVSGVGALLAQLGVSNVRSARIIVETGESLTGVLPIFDPPRVNAANAVAAA